MVRLCIRCQTNETIGNDYICESCDAENRAYLCYRIIQADLNIKKEKIKYLTPRFIENIENYWLKYYTPLGILVNSEWYKIFRLKVRNLREQNDKQKLKDNGKEEL